MLVLADIAARHLQRGLGRKRDKTPACRFGMRVAAASWRIVVTPLARSLSIWLRLMFATRLRCSVSSHSAVQVFAQRQKAQWPHGSARRQGGRRADKGLEPLARHAVIVTNIRGAKRNPRAVAKDDVHLGRLDALRHAEQVGVNGKLYHMFGFGGARQLRVGDVIGIVAELGGVSVDAQKEIGKPVPRRVEERALVDDIGTIPHRLAGGGDARIERSLIGNFRDREAFLAQAREIGLFVLDAFFLKQLCLFVILGQHDGLRELPQIEDGRMRATEVIHEIGR